MKKILTILMCLLLVPIALALEESAVDSKQSVDIYKVQYTALGVTDCSDWNNKCSTSGLNAYYYSCYRKADGACSCYLKYCDTGYNCVSGVCKKLCVAGTTWECSTLSNAKMKTVTDSSCTSTTYKYACASDEVCKMDGTTASCVKKCTASTKYECSTLSNARLKIVTDSSCLTTTYKYACGSDEICSDGECIKEGKCTEGYVCPSGYTCNSDKYYCSALSPNKRNRMYQELDCTTTTYSYTCASGYSCENGNCIKLETGCSSPTAKVNDYYCKDGKMFKCASNNQWISVSSLDCPSGCKTSIPSTDYTVLCSNPSCSESKYPDYCGTDGKLRYDIHWSASLNKCAYYIKTCPDNTLCLGGGDKCVEMKTCTKDGRTFEVGKGACFGDDYYICTIDGTFYIVNNDPECVSCTDECQEDNYRECYEIGFRVCGNYDEDKCLEWGEANQCDEGCEEGDCLIPSCSEIPESPCAEAQWIDYPECFWDSSACESSDCGNEIPDPDESCETCPEDVICNPNDFCFDHTCIIRSEVCDNEEDDDNDGLTDCEDEDCIDSEICESCSTGNTLKKQCPDDSTITTHNCINGEYKKTGNKCEEVNGGIPSWLIPTIIGVVFVGGIALILLTGKKKKRRK